MTSQGKRIYERAKDDPPKGWEDVFKMSLRGLKQICGDIDTKGKPITPDPEDVFRAWDLIRPECVRVCIIGQDPFPQEGAATGVAFSSKRIDKGRNAIEASTRAFYKKLARSPLNDEWPEFEFEEPNHGRLEPWCEQGIMMINTSLTTVVGKVGSHLGRYSDLIYFTINKLIQVNRHIIWVLFGAESQSLKTTVMKGKGHYITAPHPAARGGAFANHEPCPFYLLNKVLVKLGQTPIDFRLPVDWEEEHEKRYSGKCKLGYPPILAVPKTLPKRKAVAKKKEEAPVVLSSSLSSSEDTISKPERRVLSKELNDL